MIKDETILKLVEEPMTIIKMSKQGRKMLEVELFLWLLDKGMITEGVIGEEEIHKKLYKCYTIFLFNKDMKEKIFQMFITTHDENYKDYIKWLWDNCIYQLPGKSLCNPGDNWNKAAGRVIAKVRAMANNIGANELVQYKKVVDEGEDYFKN